MDLSKASEREGQGEGWGRRVENAPMVDLDFFGIRIWRLVSVPAGALGFLCDLVGVGTAILSCSGALLRLVRSGTGISIALGNLVKRSKSSILIMSGIFSIFVFTIFVLTRNLSRLPPIFKSASPGRAPPIHGDAFPLTLTQSIFCNYQM